MNRDKYPKGSKGMIQCLVKEHKSLLDEKLGVNLSWISPIEENQFNRTPPKCIRQFLAFKTASMGRTGNG